MKALIWIAAVICAQIACIFISRVLRLPDFAAAFFSTLPTLLLTFPLLRPWMPQAPFKLWAIAAGVCSVFVAFAFFAVGRLGW